MGKKISFKKARKMCKNFLTKQVLILKDPAPKKGGAIKARPFDRDDVVRVFGAIMMAYPEETTRFLEAAAIGFEGGNANEKNH